MKIVVRCDCDEKNGAGHFSRMLSFALFLKNEGHDIHFVMRKPPSITLSRLQGLSIVELENHELAKTIKYGIRNPFLGCSEEQELLDCLVTLSELMPGLVIVDHYGYSEPMLNKLDAEFSIFVYRDFDLSYQPKFPYLNPLKKSANIAKPFPNLKFFIGSELLYKFPVDDTLSEFDIVIFFGLRDIFKLSRWALQVLTHHFPKAKILVFLDKQSDPFYWDEVDFVTSENVQLSQCDNSYLDLVRRAKLCIGAAGVSAIERAMLGIPSVSFTTSENQVLVGELLDQCFENQCVIDRLSGAVDSDHFVRICEQFLNLNTDPKSAGSFNDGRTALLRYLIEYHLADTFEGLRSASNDDSDSLFRIRFQSLSVKYSLSAVIPSYEEHAQWLRRTLNSPEHLIFVREIENQVVGFIRFDMYEGFARVSFAISQDRVGEGLGKEMVCRAISTFKKFYPGKKLIADVHQYNFPSKRILSHSGFSPPHQNNNNKTFDIMYLNRADGD